MRCGPAGEIIAGDFDGMYRRGRGKGAIVSENLAALAAACNWEMLEIAAPSGMLRLPVVGMVRDYSEPVGHDPDDLSVFRALLERRSVDLFRVYLKRGARRAKSSAGILERFERGKRHLRADEHEVRGYILKLTDQWFGLTYVQLAVAVLVAILGIVNR